MLVYLIEGIFIPLLAAYLITLVAWVAFALLQGDPGGRRPVGKNSRESPGNSL
jgi:hypothetical protein